MKSIRVPLRRFFGRLPAAVLIAELAFVRPLWASEPSPTELAIARKLFKEATELELGREWKTAAAKLREAILIKDTPGLRFHLAYCEEQMGLLVEAMLNYERAVDLLAAGAKASDVEALLEPARRSLEQRLPTLLIVIPAGVPGLVVELNGRPLAASILGRPAPVNPGTYGIQVTAPGHSRFAMELAIAEGEKKRVHADLKPLPPPSAPQKESRSEQPVPANSASASGTKTYLLVAESTFTLAALGIGVGYLMVMNSANERGDRAGARTDEFVGTEPGNRTCAEATREYPDYHFACASLDDAISDYERARQLSTIGFIGAGVGAASVVLTWALWPEGEQAPSVTAAWRQGGVFFSLDSAF